MESKNSWKHAGSIRNRQQHLRVFRNLNVRHTGYLDYLERRQKNFRTTLHAYTPENINMIEQCVNNVLPPYQAL